MKIENYQLDAEEQEILEAFELEKLKSVPDIESEKQKLVYAAKAHMKKLLDQQTR